MTGELLLPAPGFAYLVFFTDSRFVGLLDGQLSGRSDGWQRQDVGGLQRRRSAERLVERFWS